MSGEYGPCGYQWWAEKAGVATGAKVSSVLCPLCAVKVPVQIPGPWSGTLDDQIDAANAAAIAQCPGHGEPVTILEPA